MSYPQVNWQLMSESLYVDLFPFIFSVKFPVPFLGVSRNRYCNGMVSVSYNLTAE